jgi:hypothetical protein
VTVEDRRATFQYSSQPEHAAELLAQLVGRRLPVSSFAAHEVDLEEAYLRAGIGQVD